MEYLRYLIPALQGRKTTIFVLASLLIWFMICFSLLAGDVPSNKRLTFQITATIKMSGYNLLEHTLRDILCAINPSKEDWDNRFHIINEVRAVVGSIESLRGATVEPFGSFASDLFTKWGDLDITIELQNGSYISSPGRKHKQSLLADLLRALRKGGGFHRLQFISSARVPVLKFEGRYNISCDISINNLSGQMKSKMLFWINQIDGRFRDLVLLVKEWAKTHHINDPKCGTLNSYSLSLLVVFHLQTLVTPILPPLKEIYPGNMIDDLTGVRAVAEKHIEDICAVNINRIKSDKSRLINRSSLSELFISFLAKFSDICSGASTKGVSPFAGQSEDINSNMRWLPKTYALFVEDPFEQPVNTARSVSSKQLIKIAEAIKETHGVLVSANQNQPSLASVLVGPHLSLLGMRTSASTPVITQFASRQPVSGNSLKARPERKQTPLLTHSKSQNKTRAKHQNGETSGPMHALTSQKQPRSQNKIMDKHQNGETNGPMHASTSQKQPKSQNRSMDKYRNGETNEPMHLSTSQKRQVWKPRSETKVEQIGSDG